VLELEMRCDCRANYLGAVFDNKEGERIAKIVGNKKIGILQNHGIISLGKLAIDEAAWW
jgi:ribulose-5-phosphate 4-epimerase/fuculose-1-phosphate aldolase